MSGEFAPNEQIERTVSALVDQIEWLSKRCQMIDINQRSKDPSAQKHVEWALEASTIMLQLSRSVNELLTTKGYLEQGDKTKDPYLQMHDMVLRKG